MSLIIDDESNELTAIDYLKDISNQIRLLNARIEDGFNTEINLEDIQTLEDYEDGS